MSKREREIVTDVNSPYNFLLEGDNLHALYLLEKTHKGKVDVIYIDPPYNTGNRDWKYNNDYIDKNDTFRHSKWLSMMGVRLRISKRLLKEDGVLICAIDENELGTLLLLLEDIFGPPYAVDTITIVHNPRGIQGDNFSYVNEYALFVYRKGLRLIEKRKISDENIEWRDLRDNGHESLRSDAANCFYAIVINRKQEIVGFGPNMTSDLSFHPPRNVENKDGTINIYPVDVNGIERKWRYARQTVESIQHLLRAKVTKTGFDIELGKDFAPYRTVWADKKYDSNEYGTQLINSMVPGNDFSFPKSVWNTYECLRAVTLNRPNAIILDFFAGSGTTGHATLLLNKQTQGARHFILCTNNDVGEKRQKEYNEIPKEASKDTWEEWQNRYGIAASVTYPRIKSAIQGYRHNKDFKELLFQKALNCKDILNGNSKLVKEIENIKIKYKNNFDEIKCCVEDNEFRVYGVIAKSSNIDGITANLKYFKTDFISKESETLVQDLNLHVKELIELENGVDIDNKTHLMILTEEDLDSAIAKWDEISNTVVAIYRARQIMYTAAQKKLFEHVRDIIIPDYYFAQELAEQGQNW